MPTIHREVGFQFQIYTDDHPPPHVHVRNSDGVVRIALGDQATAPFVLSRVGMKDHDAVRATLIVDALQEVFLKEWRKIHG